MRSLVSVEDVLFVDQEQAALKTMFESPGYLLLKELLAANAVKHEAAIINMEPYSEHNQVVVDQVNAAKFKAATYSAFLDALDDVEQNHNLWLRVKLEQRH